MGLGSRQRNEDLAMMEGYAGGILNVQSQGLDHPSRMASLVHTCMTEDRCTEVTTLNANLLLHKTLRSHS